MLEYTGERFMPSENGRIKYEHVHRYALALGLAQNKTVLDIASGEGYGAALLARAAHQVTGVDIAPQAIEHARAKYAGQANLQFLLGSCANIPLPAQAVELVTSFETIEHHAQHEEMLAEIKRVLTPQGALLISSPNRLVYSDLPKYSNPYHVKELYFEELDVLLRRHFRHVRYYGQRLGVGSFVYDLQPSGATDLPVFGGNEDGAQTGFRPLPNAVYFLVVCSDEFIEPLPTLQSLFIDPTDDILQVWNEEIDSLAESLQQAHQFAADQAAELNAEIARLTELLRQAHQVAVEQNKSLVERDKSLQALNQTLDEILRSRAWNFVQFIWRWRSRLRA